MAARIALLFGGIVLGLALAELGLRLYNPILFTVRGDQISLPANVSIEIENHELPGIAETIHYSRNSIGFRGPEPPDPFGDHLSIVTVGGSTTECLYLSDDRTWPHLLGERLSRSFDRLWLNNGGLDGHSTYGHTILMENYLSELKPKVVLILAGMNDRSYAPRGNQGDRAISGSLEGGKYLHDAFFLQRAPKPREVLTWAAEHSEVASMALNLSRYLDARAIGVHHRRLDLTQIPSLAVDADVIQEIVERSRPTALRFEQRLVNLIGLARKHGIEPVLLTQSLLWGDAIDDVTGVDLASIRVGAHNGSAARQALEVFNDAARRAGASEGAFLVDLSAELSLTSRYYYDSIHYTEAGADAVAAVIARDLCPHLAERYPTYFKGQCVD